MSGTQQEQAHHQNLPYNEDYVRQSNRSSQQLESSQASGPIEQKWAANRHPDSSIGESNEQLVRSSIKGM